ncbi:MAG: hypothetical protein EB100_05250 [Crocinitomicaceae bacterium]|nr:hypothetical protein [Crocinitomicaceae bacterium]
MTKKITLIILLINTSLSFGQSGVSSNQLQLNAITTSMPFLSINPDSRSGALGDAGTALSATASSIYWNTAATAFSKKNGEIGISYVPWLRQLTNDIHLSYLSGYKRIRERHAISGALRYFSLGEITFTDNQGQVLRNDKPSEFELAAGYAFKLTDRFSIGINGKFAYSNLTGGLPIPGSETKAGVAGMTDVSILYSNSDIIFGGKNGTLNLGATINNVGNKVSYSSRSSSDFLPTSLKLGAAYTTEIDKYNSFTTSIDLQKLLVPTPPLTTSSINYSDIPSGTIVGKSNDVGVIAGMIQSFYDAPGTPVRDAKNKLVYNSDGSIQVESNSKLIEELKEINIGGGLEYNYMNLLAVRGGYFFESQSKGGRQFFTLGVGLKYNVIGFDISYLAAVSRNNPLANTVRFSVRFDLGSN